MLVTSLLLLLHNHRGPLQRAFYITHTKKRKRGPPHTCYQRKYSQCTTGQAATEGR